MFRRSYFVNGDVYGVVMADVIQIAFQINDDDLERVDSYIPDQYPSRAAALREAVTEWLERRRRAEIDLALERGYDDVPEDKEIVEGLTSSSTEALAGAHLEW